MEELFGNVTNLVYNLGPIFGFLLIFVESIIPILPLATFIALNVIAFGSFIGFLISWIATIVGCMFMFFLCRKLSSKFNKHFKKNKKIMNIKKEIESISFSNLVLLMAIPFTPAFAINIAGGLSDINYKKYFFSLLIGKIPMVYFWAFIGKTLSESITDIYTLLQICLMLILALLVSKVANKYLRF